MGHGGRLTVVCGGTHKVGPIWWDAVAVARREVWELSSGTWWELHSGMQWPFHGEMWWAMHGEPR